MVQQNIGHSESSYEGCGGGGAIMGYSEWKSHGELTYKGEMYGNYAEYVLLMAIIQKLKVAAEPTTLDEDMSGKGDIKLFTRSGPIFIDLKTGDSYNKMSWEKGDGNYYVCVSPRDVELTRSDNSRTIQQLADVLNNISRDANK